MLVTNGCSWVYGDTLKNPRMDNFATTLATSGGFNGVQNLSTRRVEKAIGLMLF